jgi:hypothetical protein
MHKTKFPTAAALVDSSTFMDDFAAGAEDDNGEITLFHELTAMMRQIRLPMAKWVTNSEQLKGIWSVYGLETKKETQVLGVEWNTESDTFSVDHRDITDKLLDGPATKRQLLGATARFYDPLGLLSRASIIGKLLFQDTWLSCPNSRSSDFQLLSAGRELRHCEL